MIWVIAIAISLSIALSLIALEAKYDKDFIEKINNPWTKS